MNRYLSIALLAGALCLPMAACGKSDRPTFGGDTANNLPPDKQQGSSDPNSSTQAAPSQSDPAGSAASSSAYPSGQPAGAPVDNGLNGANTDSSGGERSSATPPPVRPPK